MDKITAQEAATIKWQQSMLIHPKNPLPRSHNKTRTRISRQSETDDNSNLMLWFALMFISGGRILGMNTYGKKEKKMKPSN